MAQVIVRKFTGSAEPLLLTYTKYGCTCRRRQILRPLVPLDASTCVYLYEVMCRVNVSGSLSAEEVEYNILSHVSWNLY